MACSFVRHGKIAEQVSQTFQNGYTLLAFQCFGAGECFSSASFNNTTMISGDDLIRPIRDNSEGGIIVVVHVQIFDWLPRELIMFYIVA